MGPWEEIGLSFVRALSYLVVMVSSLGAMVLVSAAAPGFVERERSAARSGMRRCFLWGMVFAINSILVAALLHLTGGLIGTVLALVVMLVLLGVTLSGLAAISIEAGRRILSTADRHDPSVLLCLTTGTVLLFVTGVIPVLGWLLFAGAILTGIGAFLDSAVEDWRPRRNRLEFDARSPSQLREEIQ